MKLYTLYIDNGSNLYSFLNSYFFNELKKKKKKIVPDGILGRVDEIHVQPHKPFWLDF